MKQILFKVILRDDCIDVQLDNCFVQLNCSGTAMAIVEKYNDQLVNMSQDLLDLMKEAADNMIDD